MRYLGQGLDFFLLVRYLVFVQLKVCLLLNVGELAILNAGAGSGKWGFREGDFPLRSPPPHALLNKQNFPN